MSAVPATAAIAAAEIAPRTCVALSSVRSGLLQRLLLQHTTFLYPDCCPVAAMTCISLHVGPLRGLYSHTQLLLLISAAVHEDSLPALHLTWYLHAGQQTAGKRTQQLHEVLCESKVPEHVTGYALAMSGTQLLHWSPTCWCYGQSVLAPAVHNGVSPLYTFGGQLKLSRH